MGLPDSSLIFQPLPTTTTGQESMCGKPGLRPGYPTQANSLAHLQTNIFRILIQQLFQSQEL